MPMPLQRLADSLDRSHGQRIRSLECKVRENDFLVTLNVPPETDIDLDLCGGAIARNVPHGLRKGLTVARD
jgi:hypothetical protein